MSQVNIVNTDFSDQKVIVETLKEMGFNPSVNEKQQTALHRAYGDGNTKCEVTVSRENFNKVASGNAYDGLGFQKNGNKYSLVIDSMDRQYFNMDDFTQLYAKRKVVNELNRSGMWGVESVQKNKAGEIKIQAFRLM